MGARSADADPKVCRHLCERQVLTQAYQYDQRTSGRTQLAPAFTLTRTISIVIASTSACGRPSAAGYIANGATGPES
ncbi:hypothetical protein GCM10010245_91690 [Streptomyces spectabilis]|nr:hypothetical protein GCM10010245_91690 [Streptomyces spectabilis]